LDLQKRLNDLVAKRAGLVGQASALLEQEGAFDGEAYAKIKAEVESISAEVEALKETLALKGDVEGNPGLQALAAGLQAQKEEDYRVSQVDRIRSSNEYARAFALAARMSTPILQLAPEVAANQLAPLFEAMRYVPNVNAALTEGVGGSGGFLVPIDIENQIRELRRAMIDFAAYANVENVTTATGWRVLEVNKAAQILQPVAELGSTPASEQPQFRQVSYAIATRRGKILLSQELVDDEAANLFAYLARWMARKAVLTENNGLISLWPAASVGFDDTNPLATLKSMLNVSLEPEIALNSRWFTNQNGFNYLDQLLDADGRPLLAPDPTAQTGKMLLGKPVVVSPNSFLPDVDDDTAPLYLGDMALYETVFRRLGFELEFSRYVQGAWDSYGVEGRMIKRDDYKVFDAEAFIGTAIEY
jgi:HK97 family phage major capsid protein